MTDKEYKDINDLIFKLPEKEIESLSNASELRRKSIYYCRALGLIKDTKPMNYELDEKGVLVIEDGGIENYLENIRIEKELNKNIKKLTERNLKNDFRNNIIYAVSGALLGLLASILSLLVLPNNTKETIELLNTLVIEKSERDLDFQKHLNAIDIELLSMKNEVDSLKNK